MIMSRLASLTLFGLASLIGGCGGNGPSFENATGHTDAALNAVAANISEGDGAEPPGAQSARDSTGAQMRAGSANNPRPN